MSYAQGEHVNGMNSEHDDEDDEESFGADYAKKAALATALSTLRAAALVNRAWFAAALPLLWRRPPSHALSDRAVTVPARRAMYASHFVGGSVVAGGRARRR